MQVDQNMRLTRSMFLAVITGVFIICMFNVSESTAQTFGGDECTDDCSGHKAGYEWAEKRNITDPSTCESILSRSPNSTSFSEGCKTFTEDPSRGADEDDDGKEIDD
jgi:hypothetical protein